MGVRSPLVDRIPLPTAAVKMPGMAWDTGHMTWCFGQLLSDPVTQKAAP
jgi:hypothetical protein